jgi:hypothetical protein
MSSVDIISEIETITETWKLEHNLWRDDLSKAIRTKTYSLKYKLGLISHIP